jgi:hypothetical protein
MRFSISAIAFTASLVVVGAQDLQGLPTCAVSRSYSIPLGALHTFVARFHNIYVIVVTFLYRQTASFRTALHRQLQTHQRSPLTLESSSPALQPPCLPQAANSQIQNVNALQAVTPSRKAFLHAFPTGAQLMRLQVRRNQKPKGFSSFFIKELFFSRPRPDGK